MNDINEEKHAIIGTLAEGSVHRALKYFVDSNEAHHECKIDGFVLDVFNGSEINLQIFEIDISEQHTDRRHQYIVY